ncbi:hypothetical protein EST38_g10372 [Candolleomyces aberdarensis]|uniref:Uncharacterized protein n=1 Tax=Candolleomyces aberdarensis TaxID=2316362 RepID=A0A4V1Q2L2_9AGAR|nr:hypothetical protein EST38_g10372 [Candolleomyces aberdarensis]
MAPKKQKGQDPPANICGPRILCSSSSAVKSTPTNTPSSLSRRTPAQVKAEQEAKQAERKAEQVQKQASLVALSQKEVEILQQERQAAANANHPPANMNQVKQPRKRIRSPSLEPDTDNTQDSEGFSSEAMTPEIEMRDTEASKGYEHQLPDSSDDAESNPTPRSKRQRGDTREVVHGLRAFNLDPPTLVLKSGSQKSRGNSSAKKWKTSSIPTGLRDDWGSGAHHCSVATGSAMSIDWPSKPDIESGSENETPGGVSDNEDREQAEHAGTPPGKLPRPEDRYQLLGKQALSAKIINKLAPTLTQVKQTSSVKDFISPAEAQKILSAVHSKKKKKDITTADIPSNISQSFQKIFVPRLLEWAGTQHPWHLQMHQEIVGLWDTVFPDKPLENSEVEDVVIKIAGDKISSWRNHIAQQALLAAEAMWPLLPGNSTEVRQIWIKWALT